MVTLAERISESKLRRSRRLRGSPCTLAAQHTTAVKSVDGDNFTRFYPQGSTGIPGCEIKYPGAAAQPRPSASAGFRLVNGAGRRLNINGANTYQFVMSNPVGNMDPSGFYFGAGSDPIIVGRGTWMKANPPDVRLAPGHTEWYLAVPFRQYRSVVATRGLKPGGNFAVRILKRVLRKVPFVAETRAWAKAIETDLTITHLQWLFRLKATFTGRYYWDVCRSRPGLGNKVPLNGGRIELQDLGGQWQDSWPGPGSVEGFHPVAPGLGESQEEVAKSLLDITQEFLKK